MIEQFYKPRTIQEALGLKKKFKDGAIYLAGGTLVNSKDFPLRHEHVISLEGLKQNQIAGRKGEVKIGALATLQQMLESELMPDCLKTALAQVVSRNIRNAATLGGHIAAGKSCSDLLPVLIALEAELVIYKTAAKTVLLEDYLEERPEGLIAEIIIPKTHLARRAAFGNLRHSANATSTLTTCVSLELDDGMVVNPIVALGGARKLCRLSAVENKLEGKPLPPVDELERLVRARCA